MCAVTSSVTTCGSRRIRRWGRGPIARIGRCFRAVPGSCVTSASFPSNWKRSWTRGEPPVYFGFGSIRAPQGLSAAMIDAARAVGRRAIVSRGWAELSPTDNEPDCFAIGEVNLQELLARVAAAVHHGGAGTTTTAALAGAPQVVIPQVYDQHYWAQRIQQLGIGVAHAPGTPTADSLAAALDVALRPNVARQARTLAAAIRLDGAEAAAIRVAGVTS